MGRLALEQVNRVLDDQSNNMEEQSRKNERAARFSVGLLVAGIAVVSLLLAIEWRGGMYGLVVVVALFGFFFLQAVASAVGSIRLSTLSSKNMRIGIGPQPPDILQGFRAGRYRSEPVFLKSLLVLAGELHRKNEVRLVRLSRKADRLVVLNITSIFWLVSATLIYVLGGWVQW